MTTISLKIPPSLEQRLKLLAGRRGISRSALIRDAVEAYVAGGSGRRESILMVVADLVGSVEGPADLSHNKKHLKGFGQ
jgi:metal-responsive CopG/Arc/MetJ family transcriptional regulator